MHDLQQNSLRFKPSKLKKHWVIQGEIQSLDAMKNTCSIRSMPDLTFTRF